MSELYKQRMGVEVPARCSIHQCVKGAAMATGDEAKPMLEQKRCVFCKHYTLGLSSKRCGKCLHTDNLGGFMRDEYAPSANKSEEVPNEIGSHQ